MWVYLYSMSETRFRFDNSLTSEERFAFRTWIPNFCRALTACHQQEILEFLSPAFIAKGFSEATLNRISFSMSMSSAARKIARHHCFFSELTISKKNGVILALGSYAETKNKALVLEGNMKLKVENQNQNFSLTEFGFFPRLRIIK